MVTNRVDAVPARLTASARFEAHNRDAPFVYLDGGARAEGGFVSDADPLELWGGMSWRGGLFLSRRGGHGLGRRAV